MNRKTSLVPTMLVCLLFCSQAFGQARSIQSFVEAEEKWPQTIGTTWRLEGRYALISEDSMRFVNCSMPFIFGSNVNRPPGRFTNLEVTGKIERRDGKLVFAMSSIRSRPSDMERLIFEKSAINADDAAKWYELASWASRRANFYNDPALREASQEIQRTGLEIEFRGLKPSDRNGLVSLIQKARKFKLDQVLIEEFLHDGYWDRFLFIRERDRATKTEDYADLLVSVSNDMEGARKPLETYDAEKAKAYLENAKGIFKAASEEERETLERYFYIHIATTKILNQADTTGKNAFQIAAELKKEVPERTDFIDQYEEAGLKYESQRIPVMTRQEMQNLANRYAARDDAAGVTRTKTTWLNARESLYTDNGARGLVDLAEEWIQLLNDRKTAAKYYIAAWKQNSQYPLAAAWLRQNGYALNDGEWVPAEMLPPSQESAIEKAIREGRIVKGMTTTQVKTAMGVAPDSVVRFATNGKVTELWVFQSAGAMVQFTWTLGKESSTVDTIRSIEAQPEIF